jgi:hypothetical protein
LDHAEQLLSNPGATQQELDDAEAGLRAALAGLVGLPDTAILSGLLASIDDLGLVASGFTPASWNVFESVLTDAQAAAAARADQNVIDLAAGALRAGLAGLVRVADTSTLTGVIAQVHGLNLVASAFTTDSWAVYTTALDHATQVAASPDASQQVVDAAAGRLAAALGGLQPAPGQDTDDQDQALALAAAQAARAALVGLTGQAAGLDAAAHTPESWAVYTRLLEAAKAVLARPDATAEQLNAQVAALTGGIVGLKPVSTPVKPEDTPGGTQPPLAGPGVTVAGLRTSVKTIYVRKGVTVSVPVVVDATQGAGQDVAVAWKVSKAKVASLIKGKTSGSLTAKAGAGLKVKVKALRAGTSKVTLKAGGKKLTLIIKVVKRTTKTKRAVITGGRTRTLAVGAQTTLGVRLVPAKAATPVRWKSSNPAVATVDTAGRITAIKAGKAKITATVKGKKATITTTVR